jgi:hypothetical protein
MRKLPLVLATLLMGALTANADNLVTVRPAGTDSVDWSQLGPVETAIPSPFSFTTANSVAGTGSYANPENSYEYFGGPGVVMQQGVSWNGAFAYGDYANWNENTGALTLSFAQGYSQIGAQIMSDYWGPYTAQICDANGCFTEDGTSSGNGDNSAVYLGIAGSDINWVTFSLTNAPYGSTDDFAINDVTLTATPEPSSLLLFGSGLVGLAGALRRKYARQRI